MIVEFTFLGEKQFSRELFGLGQRAGNAKPVLTVIAGKMQDANREQFASQGRRASGGWQPLAASTVKRKGHDTILFDTGDLLDSMISDTSFDVSDDYLHFLPPDEQNEIGSYHQSGTRHMPRRRPFELTEQDAREYIRDIQLWILRRQLR